MVMWFGVTKTDNIESKDGTNIEEWRSRKIPGREQYVLTNQTYLYRLNSGVTPSKTCNLSNDFFPMVYKGIQCTCA